MPSGRHSALFGAITIAAAVLAATGSAAAAVPLTRVSTDPFTNASSQHATEVEPDTFADHGVVIGTFQVGRFFDGGATDIGVVRSATSGASWDAPAFLPGITFTAGAGTNFERVSDPSVAYDAAHGTWLISSLPLKPDTSAPKMAISRSIDDGVTWRKPVFIPKPPGGVSDLDKNWSVCDNTPTSPFYGHCYTTFDNFGDNNRMLTSTSTDGGLTWSVPIPTAANDIGIGSQPLVQPNGTVIVPFQTFPAGEAVYRSTNGGASWTAATKIATIGVHRAGGGLRTSALPTAEMDNAGNVFVAWQDCRFRAGCSANDIVFRSSADGVTWSTTKRIPIDAPTSGADHFIPGLAVKRDATSSGATADLALTYYFYPDTTCAGGCQLEVGYITSPDAGAHWSAPTTLAGPMSLSDIAQTSQGPMVGDYISTSFAGSNVVTVFSVGLPHVGSVFDEAMYAPTTPLTVARRAQATRPPDSGAAEPGAPGGTTPSPADTRRAR